MINSYLKAQGEQSGARIINYLLNHRTQDGTAIALSPRSEIERQKRLLALGINKTARSLNFHASDNLTPQQELEIIESFEKNLFPNLKKGVDYSITWTKHTDKGRTELNYVILHRTLSTGRRFTPFWIAGAGKNNKFILDLECLKAWEKVTRMRYNLTDPNDQERTQTSNQRRIKDLKKLAKDTKNKAKIKEFNFEKDLRQRAERGDFKSRAELIKALQAQGLIVKTQKEHKSDSQNDDYIIILNQKALEYKAQYAQTKAKAKRGEKPQDLIDFCLKGEIFSENFKGGLIPNNETINEKTTLKQHTAREYEQALRELERLKAMRAENLAPLLIPKKAKTKPKQPSQEKEPKAEPKPKKIKWSVKDDFTERKRILFAELQEFKAECEQRDRANRIIADDIKRDERDESPASYHPRAFKRNIKRAKRRGRERRQRQHFTNFIKELERAKRADIKSAEPRESGGAFDSAKRAINELCEQSARAFKRVAETASKAFNFIKEKLERRKKQAQAPQVARPSQTKEPSQNLGYFKP